MKKITMVAVLAVLVSQSVLATVFTITTSNLENRPGFAVYVNPIWSPQPQGWREIPVGQLATFNTGLHSLKGLWCCIKMYDMVTKSWSVKFYHASLSQWFSRFSINLGSGNNASLDVTEKGVYLPGNKGMISWTQVAPNDVPPAVAVGLNTLLR